MAEFVAIELQVAAITLAKELNYTYAAKRLNIARSELNRQIAELESRLGLQIFRANGEDVAVTEAGQLFVSACRTFLAARCGLGAIGSIQD